MRSFGSVSLEAMRTSGAEGCVGRCTDSLAELLRTDLLVAEILLAVFFVSDLLEPTFLGVATARPFKKTLMKVPIKNAG